MTIELGDLVTQQDAQRLADQVFGSANDCACAVIVDIAPLYEEIEIRSQVALFSDTDIQQRMRQVDQALQTATTDPDDFDVEAYLANYERYQLSLERGIRNQRQVLPRLISQQRDEGSINDRVENYGNRVLEVSRYYLAGTSAELKARGVDLNPNQQARLDQINTELAKDVYADKSLAATRGNDSYTPEVARRLGKLGAEPIVAPEPVDDFVYDERLAEFGIDEGTARLLADQGYDLTVTGAQVLVRRISSTGLTSFSVGLTRIGGAFLSPAISVLDSAAANGVANLQTRRNIDEYYRLTNDLELTIYLRQLLSEGRHTDVALKLAEKGYQYQNLVKLAGDKP